MTVDNKEILGINEYNSLYSEGGLFYLSSCDPAYDMARSLLKDIFSAEKYQPFGFFFYFLLDEFDDVVWLKRLDYLLYNNTLCLQEIVNKIVPELRKRYPNFVGIVTNDLNISHYVELIKELYPGKKVNVRWPLPTVGIVEDYPVGPKEKKEAVLN